MYDYMAELSTNVAIPFQRTYDYIMQVRTTLELGGTIRSRRRQLGWSQEQLAATVGVSRRWVIGVEHGKSSAEVSLVLRTLNALGLVTDVIEAPVAHGSRDLDRILDDYAQD
jgi:y4mF family transcriptional regulator